VPRVRFYGARAKDLPVLLQPISKVVLLQTKKFSTRPASCAVFFSRQSKPTEPAELHVFMRIASKKTTRDSYQIPACVAAGAIAKAFDPDCLPATAIG